MKTLFTKTSNKIWRTTATFSFFIPQTTKNPSPALKWVFTIMTAIPKPSPWAKADSSNWNVKVHSHPPFSSIAAAGEEATAVRCRSRPKQSSSVTPYPTDPSPSRRAPRRPDGTGIATLKWNTSSYPHRMPGRSGITHTHGVTGSDSWLSHAGGVPRSPSRLGVGRSAPTARMHMTAMTSTMATCTQRSTFHNPLSTAPTSRPFWGVTFISCRICQLLLSKESPQAKISNLDRDGVNLSRCYFRRRIHKELEKPP